ncbi:MAG TPA: ATP-dependent DNA ligase [Gemmatimonadales bacterium]|nr:ATP-dependent DNA ligase [Gemmatimonadales bacterium]
MKLAALVDTSRRIAETSGRLEKIGLLAALLASVPPDEIEIASAFLSGSLLQTKVGVGYAALQAGMPSAPAESPSLELREVNAAFEQIAQVSAGKGSIGERVRLLGDLLSRATRMEQEFLFRLVVGELRQGAVEGLMLEAVAKAAGVPAEQVRRARMMTGELPTVARAALTGEAAGLASYATQLFRPVQPMLAGSAEDAEVAIEELGEAVLEYKLDGARIQVHKAGDQIAVYSRRLNDVTAAVPELVEAMRALPARELILDGEVIALRPGGAPHPFQTTMSRFGRRLQVDQARQEVPLTPFFFDLLYLDGGSLVDEPGRRRLTTLLDAVPQSMVVPRISTSSPVEAQRFLQAALDHGHEGIMAKALDAPYQAGHRGRRWLKVKPANTLDLVVLAAEWGHGRRHGWLSNLHLGARDPASGEFVMLGKTFKGMTDAMLDWQTKKLLELEVARDGHTVYVRPELVVETAFNEVQGSSQYPGGVALRFARIKRYRTDKTAAEADTIGAVREIFRRTAASDTLPSPP